MLLVSAVSFGQSEKLPGKPSHEVSADLGAFYTPLLSRNVYGFNFDMKYYPVKRWATGLTASIATKKTDNSYQYTIGKPIISYDEFGWINQYDLVHKDQFRLNVNLNNGMAIAKLGDNADKVLQWTRYGNVEVPKKIATNYFYLLQPGLDISFRVYNHRHDPDIYLTAKAKYRYVFGDSKYGQLSDFSNYYVGFGISLIGFAD
jgi:hypothetical protein